jgi:hypothetical protein
MTRAIGFLSLLLAAPAAAQGDARAFILARY